MIAAELAELLGARPRRASVDDITDAIAANVPATTASTAPRSTAPRRHRRRARCRPAAADVDGRPTATATTTGSWSAASCTTAPSAPRSRRRWRRSRRAAAARPPARPRPGRRRATAPTSSSSASGHRSCSPLVADDGRAARHGVGAVQPAGRRASASSIDRRRRRSPTCGSRVVLVMLALDPLLDRRPDAGRRSC